MRLIDLHQGQLLPSSFRPQTSENQNYAQLHVYIFWVKCTDSQSHFIKVMATQISPKMAILWRRPPTPRRSRPVLLWRCPRVVKWMGGPRKVLDVTLYPVREQLLSGPRLPTGTVDWGPCDRACYDRDYFAIAGLYRVPATGQTMEIWHRPGLSRTVPYSFQPLICASAQLAPPPANIAYATSRLTLCRATLTSRPAARISVIGTIAARRCSCRTSSTHAWTAASADLLYPLLTRAVLPTLRLHQRQRGKCDCKAHSAGRE